MWTETLHPETRVYTLLYRLGSALLGLPASLGRWAQRRRAIARTVSELSAMSDRELADLGIPRCDIRRLACEAVGRGT